MSLDYRPSAAQPGALSCTATQDCAPNISITRLMGAPVPEVPTGIVIGIEVAKIDGVHGGAANTVTHTEPSVGSKRGFM